MIDLDEYADQHGYMSYRCPKCYTRFYDDSAPTCPSCGYSDSDSGGDRNSDDDRPETAPDSDE